MESRSYIEIERDKNDKLFCFFTGTTRGMVTVEDIQVDQELRTYRYTLSISQDIPVTDSPYIQIDGVLCEVVKGNNHLVTASTTFELLENTSLKNISRGDKVSIGVLAELDPSEIQNFLIHPTANSMATVKGFSVLSGHTHTLKIDFSYNGDVALEEDKHVGLSGSSLLVRELKKDNGLQLFSIYAGRQTRDNTRFNHLIKEGDLVNITAAKLDEPIEQPYPHAFRSPSRY